jgi:hypothetical protein
MTKPILVGSTVAALALGGFAVHSYGQSVPTPTTCYRPNLAWPLSLTYDTNNGVTLSLTDAAAHELNATVPLRIGNEPNPHFDRLYSLLMKGMDNRRIHEVCVEGAGTSSEPRAIVSVEIHHTETR